MFYFHPYLEKRSILINIFQMGWFNHQLDKFALAAYIQLSFPPPVFRHLWLRWNLPVAASILHVVNFQERPWEEWSPLCWGNSVKHVKLGFGEATAVIFRNLYQIWYSGTFTWEKSPFFSYSVRYHQNSKWLKFLCWFWFTRLYLGGWWRLTLNMWGISLLGSTHSVTLYGETSETGLCQIFAILGDGSMVQTFRCVRWCKQGVLSRNQFGSGGWKMKIEKFMTRMDTLGSWIWLVQTEISGSQKYINLRVAEKNSLRESKIIQQKLTTDRDDPRCTVISKTKSLIVSSSSHLSNRGRFDWWIDLANPGLQPLSSRLL